MVNIGDWLPLTPWQGLPLPKFLGLYWPWAKEKLPGVGVPPVGPPVEYTMADVGVAGYPETVMLEGARVEIVGVGYGITRPYDGNWGVGCYIRNIPVGDHEVHVSATGYQGWSGTIDFPPGGTRTFFIRVYRR